MSTQSSPHELNVFPWNDNFETGYPKIDEQHKMLIELLNKLASTLTLDQPIGVNQAFQELIQYANYHFKSEEAIWSEYFDDDSWFLSHQTKHASFLPEVLKLQRNGAMKPQNQVIEEIIQYLISWLAHHIIDDDKRMAAAIDAINSGSSLEEAKAIADAKMHDSLLVLFEAGMMMYQVVSSRSLSLIRERNARLKIEAELIEANKKLEVLSITDQLTGLHNRRHFDNVIKVELQRARRDKKSLILISFDIDYFKKLNDRYGHSVGDEALQKVGECLQEVCRRPSDFAFRLGGEEFAMISTSETEAAGDAFGEIIRKHIQDLHIPNKDSEISEYMTVSAGVVVATPNEISDIDTLMKIVDKRLYAAKSLGRNRVISSDEYREPQNS